MLACAESNFSNLKFEYLRENEFLRKTILALLSGAQMGSIHEENRGRKSRDTARLTSLYKITRESAYIKLFQLKGFPFLEAS